MNENLSMNRHRAAANLSRGSFHAIAALLKLKKDINNRIMSSTCQVGIVEKSSSLSYSHI